MFLKIEWNLLYPKIFYIFFSLINFNVLFLIFIQIMISPLIFNSLLLIFNIFILHYKLNKSINKILDYHKAINLWYKIFKVELNR